MEARRGAGSPADIKTPADPGLGNLFARLNGSAFRSRFHLSAKDIEYARAHGRDTIDRHAHELLRARLVPANPEHDGHQTPFRGHPVFVAQHATATCCRGCLAKWHGIPSGRELADDQLEYACAVVIAWIERELAADVGGAS